MCEGGKKNLDLMKGAGDCLVKAGNDYLVKTGTFYLV